MEIRPAVPEDALAVARVHVQSWQAAYRGLLPDEYLDALRPEDRAPRYDFTRASPETPYTLIAVEADEVLGFATTMPSRDESLADYGELSALYVAPKHWRKGIGTMLTAAAIRYLISCGYRDALLWILAGNAQAEHFYQKDGWRPDGVRRSETIWDITVDELRYVRRLMQPA